MSDKPKKQGCSGCPRLKLIQSPEERQAPEARNFWNTCPRQLEGLPESPCELGKPIKGKNGRLLKEPGCPWWIDSEEHNYCFWRYVQSQSLPNGKMDSLLQNEIAELLSCSSTKIHFVVKEGIQKLKESQDLGELTEFSADGGDGDDVSAPLPAEFAAEEEPGDEEPGDES